LHTLQSKMTCGTSLRRLRHSWSTGSSLGSESSLHQLAPYIGKLKTTLARSLINEFSRPGQTILDPFSGSGVVPLECLLLGRGTVANDINPYAATLTRAKLHAPASEEIAVRKADRYVQRAKLLAHRRKYRIDAPSWARAFFHPRTFAEAKILADLLVAGRQWFLLANLLGILHHQRPGFLSYPSSHLVPYLRTKKFPRNRYPELYLYRDVGPRLVRKIGRSYRRFAGFDQDLRRSFTQENVFDLRVDKQVDVALTSPPYMNALDYGRDNRLRLWFLGVAHHQSLDRVVPANAHEFSQLLECLASILRRTVRPKGKAILVLGESESPGRRSLMRAGQMTKKCFEGTVGGWKLSDQVVDFVPDIRRSRRDCRCTKRERIMVFTKL
jgi:DNA methylase